MSQTQQETLSAVVNEVVVSAVTKKPFWKSKTLWVNLIAAAAIYAQTRWGFVVGVETQALVLTGVNAVLRVVTKEKLGW